MDPTEKPVAEQKVETPEVQTPEQIEDAQELEAVVGRPQEEKKVETPSLAPKQDDKPVVTPEVKKEEPKLETQEDWRKKYEELKKQQEQKPVEPAKVEAPQKPAYVPRALVKEEDLDKLFQGGEESVKFLNELITNIKEDMAELVLGYVNNEVIGKQIAPLKQKDEAAELARHEQIFFEQYKDLEPYKDVAKEIATRVAEEIGSGKLKVNSWEEVYKEIATRTQKLKAIFEKAGDRKQPQTPPPPSPGGTPIKATSGSASEDEADIKAVIGGSY